MKKNFIFSILSILYVVFLSKADLYSMPKIDKDIEVSSCCIEKKQDICCGKEIKEGNCQNSNCCHISTVTATFSVNIQENILEISKSISNKINFKFESLKDFYVDTYQSLISEYESYFQDTYKIFLSYLQSIHAFLGVWRN